MHSSILQAGRNVWCVEKAARAAVLVDGAAFFEAVRQAFLNARRSIFIVGWDIDSRTRLVGESNGTDDGYSPVLAELLGELAGTRPDLHVYLLLWDYSVVYAAEREMFPRLSLQWMTPERVMLCMDDAVPFGSSQHQKLIVVDDALAFSGGLDLTQRRWDTAEHKADDPARVDASGHPYAPFHDVQMMVDGKAAEALARLARTRWCRAYGSEPRLAPEGDPWPHNVAPQFTDVEIGVARTQPAFETQAAVREVETLFYDSIAMARRSIYIENQFVASLDVANRLARRLEQCPELEVVIVSPRAYTSWVVSQTLGQERLRFAEIVKRAGGDRVRMVYPSRDGCGAGSDIMVHSKVMVVDDRLIRIGSANLNNRSMGTDTECDLAIEAKSDTERATIAELRNRLLGHHCGADAETVAAMLAEQNSLTAVADRLSKNGHRLCPLGEQGAARGELAETLRTVVDPKQPLSLARIWNGLRMRTRIRAGTIAAATMAGLIVLLTLVWSLLPSDLVSGERARSVLSSAASSGWAPLLVLATYLVAGAVAFPVTLLIVATAAIFGPLLGFLYATLGVVTSAVLMYFVGNWLGRDALRRLVGPRFERVCREIDRRGVLAVAAIRMVPMAPFTVINLMAGACSIALADFVAGTLIGMAPGLIAISVLGHQITAVLTSLSVSNVALLILALLAWLALAFSAQTLVSRWRGQAS
jgi:phospholipase D1/2